MQAVNEPQGFDKGVHWADMCRSLRMLGLMKNFSKSECLRVRQLLIQQVEAGHVVPVKRGVYKLA